MKNKMILLIIIFLVIIPIGTGLILENRKLKLKCGLEPRFYNETKYIKPHNLPNETNNWEVVNGSWSIFSPKKINNKIIFLNGSLRIRSELYLYNSTLIIKSSSMREENSIKVEGYLHLDNSTITVYNAKYRYRFIMGYVWGKMILNNSEISYCKDIYIHGGNVLITNCTFSNNIEGLQLWSEGKTVVRNCLFENNSYGIWLTVYSNRKAEIKYNYFRNNNKYAVYGHTYEASLEYNYWDSTNETEISKLIYDGDADFKPWLEKPPF